MKTLTLILALFICLSGQSQTTYQKVVKSGWRKTTTDVTSWVNGLVSTNTSQANTISTLNQTIASQQTQINNLNTLLNACLSTIPVKPDAVIIPPVETSDIYIYKGQQFTQPKSGDVVLFERGGTYNGFTVSVPCTIGSFGTGENPIVNGIIITSQGVTITNLAVNNSGIGIQASNCDNLKIIDNKFSGNKQGIVMDYCQNAIVTGNVMRQIGMVGTVEMGDGALYMASCGNALVEKNDFQFCGSAAIFLFRNNYRNRRIGFNKIDNACLRISDMGAIYTSNSDVNVKSWDSIYNNTISNVPGNVAWDQSEAVGIYVDNPPSGAIQENWYVTNNTITGARYGIYVHKARNVIISGNYVSDCYKSIFDVEYKQSSNDYRNTGIQIRNNTLLGTGISLLNWDYSNMTFPVSDNNTFGTGSVIEWYNGYASKSNWYTLSQWKTLGYDLNSVAK